MDWNTIVITLLGSLATGGGIGGLFMAKENKRSKQIENDRSAAAEWKELYERAEDKVQAQSDKIEGLFRTLQEVREDRDAARKDLAVAKILICKKTACIDRTPPLGGELNEKQHNA